jgi:alpha-L-rhamnosidase
LAPGRIELTLSHVPEYDGQGYEIVGFGWQQGWNGRVNQACNDGYKNMHHLNRRIVLLFCSLGVSLSADATSVADELVGLFEQCPVSVSSVGGNAILIDFGRVAFGNVQLTPPEGATETITVHFGEKLKDRRVDRQPPGTVCYNVAEATLQGGRPFVVAPPADGRNTEQSSAKHPPAVLTPPQWGVVIPFRWLEIEGWPGELKPEQVVRRAAFAKSWDEDAACFESSDPMLNRIWELCRYSIKATTFAGLYVDGERERIPYEADAYLNQLSHYNTDNDIQMARDTYDWLMRNGTWPTEWAPHMVFMAHADWMRTGDRSWLAPRYEALKTKTLLDRAGPDGLIRSNKSQQQRDDIVDWPMGERDGYVFTEINTVVNAFHLAALERMAELALALGKLDEAEEFGARARKTHVEFQRRLFDSERGLYRDGVNTDHISLHANLFPLAFGLVPEHEKLGVVEWLQDRDMDCSVYAAQYLLEGLFCNNGARKAIELITAPTDRSWRHMVESGTTITWEAWDLKYKPNQDWNHAWGAAPANLLPRFVLGVEPLEPGWSQASIRPCPGALTRARGKVPTPRGPILIDWENNETFQVSITLPDGVLAMVELPGQENSRGVYVNGKPVQAKCDGSRWRLIEGISGSAAIELK